MNYLNTNILQGYNLICIIILFLLTILLMVLFIILNNKMKGIKEKQRRFMEGASGENLEAVLIKCIDRLDNIEATNKDRDKDINNLYNILATCIQKVGFVRYNAFHNVGSDQSFSVALLNAENTGVVISGIYGREHSSTYSKSIVKGGSKYPLSDEELKAVDMAINS